MEAASSHLGWGYAGAVALTIMVVIGTASLKAAPSTSSNPIQHVIVVMQENRSFDNYFWTYPGQIGYEKNLCMPYDPSLKNSPCLKPAKAVSTVNQDLPHDWKSTHVALNDGKMNGFLAAAGQSKSYNSAKANAVMSYYDDSTLPNLWAYAKHFVLADRYFTSATSYSQPNHWYMIAGNAPTVSLTQGETQEKKNCYDPTTGQIMMTTCAYIDEAGEISTMADLLTAHGITWKYYDTPIPKGYTLSQAIAGKGGPDAFAYWNPLFAKNSTYQSYANNVVAREELFTDLSGGTLPQVSWVIPSAGISDHPPANVTLGMWWITDIVNSVMKSQYGGNTMIVVLWDDYGGFFDTARPPTVDAAGLSIRTPALIISPYSKAGHLDHTVYDFESTLKFIEWRWGLPSLTPRDASANNLTHAMNFHQKPLKPYIIPLTATQLNAIEPYILQGSAGFKGHPPTLQFINNDPD
jgi:phospholipase C